MTVRRFLLGVIAGAALPLVAAAQATGNAGAPARESTATERSALSAHLAAAPLAQANRAGSAMSIDGRLTEPAWRDVPAITQFTQNDPTEGAPATRPTAVRILFDDEAIYIGAILRDSVPVSLRLARRDANFNDSDVFAVALDSYHDHQTAFRFVVNASGVRRDEVVTSTGGGPGGGGDTSWDPVWDAAVTVSDSGWVTEMRIPFSQLRYSREEVQTWGIQFERRIASNQEHVVFAFVPKKERGGPPRYGHVVGIEKVPSGRRLEILPYIYGRAAFKDVPLNASAGFVDPFRGPRDYATGVGGDLKYRLTSNFTLDATVNPDFGQVEVDPAVLNLSAFETRYDEKRPFFVEGAEIFRFGSSIARDAQPLYSRRVGRSPQGSVGSVAYADVPEVSTIFGAAKLTGKTSSGWSLGMLEAVTGRERAPFVDTAGQRGEVEVEPITNYFTARVKRSNAGGGTSLGGVLTAVNRDLGDEALSLRLRSAAYVGGADYRTEWGNRDYSFSAQLVGSAVRGRREVITATQRSSARYFHRPDADHLAVDSSATGLAGYNAFVVIGKFAGDWQGNATLAATSPSYEMNDMGFQTSADRMAVDVNVSYRETTPGRFFRRWDVNTGPDVNWNYGGDRVGGSMGVRGGVTLLNYWNINANLDWRASAYDDRLTRGGPLARRPTERSFGGHVNSDGRRRYTLNVQGNRSWNEAGGSSARVEFNVGMKPTSSWELRVGPEISRSRNVSQYVTSVGDALATGTYGRRYVFGTLDQTTVSLDTRMNMSFTPGLTLELYAQPYISTGDYGPLKEFRTPGTFAFDTYGADRGTIRRDTTGVYTIDPDGSGAAPAFTVSDRDFSFRSLRGNAVLRWEWRAGSTLFLVWQQTRSRNLTAISDDVLASGRDVSQFDAYRDARELFGVKPDNVFQVKMTWWLNP